MAQEIVKAFKEVVTRLKDANIEGKLLERVNLVEGPVEDSFASEDLPTVIYELLNIGLIEDACFPRGVRALLTVMITIETSADNGYYNDERAGMLDFYEKIMTVINGTAQTDLTGNGNWGPTTPQYRVGGGERDGLKNTHLVEVAIESARFTKGSLQS